MATTASTEPKSSYGNVRETNTPRRGVPGPRKREMFMAIFMAMNGEAEKACCVFGIGKVGDMFVKAEIWMFFLTLRCIFDAFYGVCVS